MYDLSAYGAMIADEVRMAAYEAAIAAGDHSRFGRSRHRRRRRDHVAAGGSDGREAGVSRSSQTRLFGLAPGWPPRTECPIESPLCMAFRSRSSCSEKS